MPITKLAKKITAAQRKRALKEPAMPAPNPDDFKLSRTLAKNLEGFQQAFGQSGDIKYHSFILGQSDRRGTLIYVDGLVDNALVTESVLKPMLSDGLKLPPRGTDIMDKLRKSVLCANEAQLTGDTAQLITGCLSGDTIVLLDGCTKGLIISTKGYETRGVTEPQTELVVRGPREGFTENLRTNTSLLRRRVRTSQLRLENITAGKKTGTNIVIAYVKDIARPELVEEVRNRIAALQIDAVLDSGYIEEYIEDSPLSMFPTIGYSEKPDVVAARILEGRVAIIVDGSPFVLSAPFLFVENFQTSEDYYIRPLYASVIRLMRLLAYFISIFLLPMFIAMTTFHQELLPTTLLFTIASAREGTPFPAFVEALILVMSFEILREAGLRLPRPVGQAISIVGALIMGDAAVAAGLVGAPMVIAVAISAVAGFVLPEQVETISLLRLMIMVASTLLGGYGIALAFLALLIHLATLNSFGVPYFTTLSISRDLQDGFIRMPLWMMRRRPMHLADIDKTRSRPFVPPETDMHSEYQEERNVS